MNQTDFNFERIYSHWCIGHAFVNIAGPLTSIYLTREDLWFGGSVLSFIILVWLVWRSVDLPYGFGLANWVTTARLIGILILVFSYDQFSQTSLFFLFLLLIGFDGLDGYIARKWSHESKEGELLDMEVDAFLVLFLSWFHVSQGAVSWWLIIPGALRYVYVFITLILPKNGADYFSKKWRATIAVFFFGSLLVPFIISGIVPTIILAVSSFCIILSFSVSILYKLEIISK